jgi:hypothetical protein
LADMGEFVRDFTYMVCFHCIGSTFVRRQVSRKLSVRRMSTFSQGGAPEFLGLCRVEPILLDHSAS